jgi:predicted transcriptional regulator
MAKKIRSRNIDLNIESGRFTGIFKRFRGERKSYDFSNISALRKLLSNERARLLSTIKNQNPKSIYELAKLLGRDFRSVRQDVRLLERFGFLELDSRKKGKREMLKPVLIIDRVNIKINI